MQRLQLLRSAWCSAQSGWEARDRALSQQADDAESAGDEARGRMSDMEAEGARQGEEGEKAMREVKRQAAERQAALQACVDAQEEHVS